MVEVINKYETIFIVDASLAEDQITALVEKFKSLISDAGEIESVDEWGKRRLAYPIDDKTEGYYVLVDFAADPQLPRELERNFKNDESILRYMVTRKEA